MKTARAKALNLRISLKKSVIVCRELKGMKLDKAKKFLNDLLKRKRDINGKYYDKVAEQMLKLIKSVEANAKKKGLDVQKLWIKNLKADKGMTYYLPKSRAKFRGRKAKMTHLTIVVEEK